MRKLFPSVVPGELPITYAEPRAMFEHLDRPDPPPCDHTLRECEEFLRRRSLPIESTLAWLRSNGGFCDCEVIFNLTEEWGEKVGWVPKSYEECVKVVSG